VARLRRPKNAGSRAYVFVADLDLQLAAAHLERRPVGSLLDGRARGSGQGDAHQKRGDRRDRDGDGGRAHRADREPHATSDTTICVAAVEK